MDAPKTSGQVWVFTFAGCMAAILVAAALIALVTTRTFPQVMVNVGLFGIPLALLVATLTTVGRRRTGHQTER